MCTRALFNDLHARSLVASCKLRVASPGFARDFGCGLPLRSRPQTASTSANPLPQLLFAIAGMHRVFPTQPSLKSKHGQNRQRQQPDLLVAERGPGKYSQSCKCGHRYCQARHLYPSQNTRRILVHREGFEPSYLARRDRFTVCWL